MPPQKPTVKSVVVNSTYLGVGYSEYLNYKGPLINSCSVISSTEYSITFSDNNTVTFKSNTPLRPFKETVIEFEYLEFPFIHSIVWKPIKDVFEN